MRKPRIFIASSSESAEVADAINYNLDHDFEVTTWKAGAFKLSSSTIEDIVRLSSSVDFAAFVFTPDDVANIRSSSERIVRDNVLFELGLFIGAIGRSRSFIVKPRGEELRIPSDLLGLTTADYDALRTDDNLFAATNRACVEIKTVADTLGPIKNAPVLNSETPRRSNPASFTFADDELCFLSQFLQTYVSDPRPVSLDQLGTTHKTILEPLQSQLAIVKFERSGLLQRELVQDTFNDYDYWGFSLTEAGVTFLVSWTEQKKQLR